MPKSELVKLVCEALLAAGNDAQRAPVTQAASSSSDAPA